MTDTPQWPQFPTPPTEPVPTVTPGAGPVPSGATRSPDGTGSAPPEHHGRGTVVVAAVVAVVMFLAGGGIGAVLVDTSRRTPAATSDDARNSQPSQTPSTQTPSTQTPSTQTPSTGTDGGTTPTTSAPAPSDGDNTVSTGVVDITTTLANDAGQAAGTGMLISSSGLVLTNNHVIENASTIKAQIGGVGRNYNATVLGYDAITDVALLQLQNASGLPTVKLGDSSSVDVGDRVTAVGNALGRSGPPTVVTGVVTALHQSVTVADDNGGSETLRDMIEVNAQIQPGDSGGPVLDSSNRVIGMVTAGSAGRRTASTTGYAVPIANAQAVVQQIRSGRSTATVHVGTRGMLGVELQAAGGRFGRGSSSGVTVNAVEKGSPAAGAGMQAGDVIRSIAGTAVASADDVGRALTPYNAGDKVQITWVDSSGQQHQATVKLAEGPPA